MIEDNEIKMKIVLIDDMDTIIIPMQALLEAKGFEVFVAYDGEEGLRKIFEEIPDFVIVDIDLPKMNGYEVVAKMRENIATMYIPVLMMSGTAPEMNEIKSLQLGAEGYLRKPFSNELLLLKLESMVSRAKQNMSLNPLTRLPGAVSINKEIEKRILSKEKFAVIYVDLNDFKVYNNYYSFERGDKVIKNISEMLKEVIKESGCDKDFLGHIGGDDFVLITIPEKVQDICENFIKKFEKEVLNFYNEKDKAKGYIEIYSRQGEPKKFGFLSVCVAVVTNANREIKHIGEVASISSELRSYIKKFNKSMYIVDRRTSNS